MPEFSRTPAAPVLGRNREAEDILHRRDGKDISVIGLLKWYSLYYPK